MTCLTQVKSGNNKYILHVDMDAFYVEVSLLKRPDLRGKPVIVGSRSPRGVVSTCSYEARKFGIHSGMASVQAERLCPSAVWLPGDFEAYSHYSKRFIEILRRYSPVVVQLSIDEARVDLTGCELLFGKPMEIAHRILLDIKYELGLPASGGLANSGTIAKIAAELSKPGGLAVILPGYEQVFISPLKVERIPGIGKKSLPKFHKHGLYRIGDIASKSQDELTRMMGRWSSVLYRIATGSAGPISRAPSQAPSRSHEVTFAEDVTDSVRVREEVRRLIERLGFRLRQENRRVAALTVKIRDAAYQTITRTVSLKTPSNSDRILFNLAIDLVHTNWPDNKGIRLIGVCAHNLVSDIKQLSLFERTNVKLETFYKTVDGIKVRFGQKSVRFGSRIASSRNRIMPRQ
ncbi:DNA polymerase IV [bacterium]|nr:DNA polymerase IV [candidate division CSSED10-310 bacterium]